MRKNMEWNRRFQTLNLLVLKSGCRAAHDAFQEPEGRQQLRHKMFDSDFTRKMRKDNRMKVVGSAPGEMGLAPCH